MEVLLELLSSGMTYSQVLADYDGLEKMAILATVRMLKVIRRIELC